MSKSVYDVTTLAKSRSEYLKKREKETSSQIEELAKSRSEYRENLLKTKTESLNAALKSAENWLPQEEMDRVLVKLDDFARTYTVDRNFYTDTVSSLKERKQVYSTFKSAEEYNAAVKESTYRQMHEGYTKEDVQKAIDRLTTASKLAGIEGETDEVKWLKNYGMNVGYSDSDSYSQEIAALDTEIARLEGIKSQKNKFDSEYRANGGWVPSASHYNRPAEGQVAYYREWKEKSDEYAKQIEGLEELKLKKAYFERKKKEVGAQELIEQKYKPITLTPDFQEKTKDAKYKALPKEAYYVPGSASADQNLFWAMDLDHRILYNYLQEFEGQGKADEYFDDMRPILNARKNEEQAKKNKEFSDKLPVISDIITLGSQLIDGTIMAPVKFVGSLTGNYEKNWASYDSLTTFTNTIRTDHAQDLNKLAGGEWAGFLYNTVMSIADMGTSIAVGSAAGKIAGVASSAANTTKIAKGVTQFIMSSEAASQTMTDARQRGLSGLQIAGLGAASATIEWLTEKIPLDNLFGAKPNYVKAVVKQIATEGTEEAISNVANTILDEIIAGNQSALKQQIADYMADGMSYKDAANKVLIDKVKEIGMDAFAGALSGAIMGGGSVALNKLSTVHFSIPTKYKGDLSSAQTWVADKFQNLKNSTNKKGLGTVVIDSQTMTDAIHKTETADQALTFAAINDIIHKGKVQLDGNVAAIGTLATLNGNTHEVVLSVSKLQNGNFWITGITMDGDATIYDARDYLQQMAENATEQSTEEQSATGQSEVSVKLVDGQDGGFDYDSLNRITQTSGQQSNGSVDGSSKVWHNSNQENIQEGENNNGSNNTELLERRPVSAANRSGNGIREQSENSRKISSFVEKLFLRQGKSVQGLRAGDSGWLVQQDNQEGKIRNRFENGIRGKISRITPSGLDTIGRKIDDGIKEKFKSTVFKDENGNLLSLYHWTQATFDLFAKGEFGFHFGTLDAARERYKQSLEESPDTQEGNYKEVYLNIANPYYIPFDAGVWCAQAVAYQLKEDGLISEQQYDRFAMTEGFFDNTYDNPAAEALRSFLSQKGYDGIIYENESEDAGSISVIALYPEQILTVAENGVLKEGNGVSEAPINEMNMDTSLPPTDGGTGSFADAQNGENEKIDYSILELEQTELDVSFLEMSEEERADFTQRFERATGTRVVFDETINAGGKYMDGVITVNPNKDTPMTVLIHELTHHIEKHPKYADFFEYVFKSEMFASWLKEKGTTLQDMRRATIALRAEKGYPLGASGDVTYEADQEILGYFLGQKVFRDMNVLSTLAQKHRNFFEWIRDFIANIAQYFRNTPIERELHKIEQMFAKVVQEKVNTDGEDGNTKYSFQGYAEDGRGKYQSNFPKGTPKTAKSQRILRYIQDVWSKKPIRLKINEGGIERYIYAQFDPTYDESKNEFNDATKLMGGNRHGTSSEQRVTLDLADDYYQIATESTYNYSKDETGKEHPAHKDVKKWHYFVNDIYFAEYGSKEYVPYRVSINVKEKSDGNFVYSFSAEKIRGQDAPQTLHAAVNEGENPNANDLSSNPIKPQSGNGVNTQYMQDGEKYSVSPVLDAEETVQGQSKLPETREQTTVGQATDELLFEEIRRRYPQLSPIDIARLKPEDAVTTPTIKNSTVRNVTGDGDSSFYKNLQNADIFNNELKTLAASNSTIMQYDRIGNQETLRAANNEINRKGRQYVGEFLHKESTEFTAQDVAAGFILMGRYNAVGDYRGAVMIAEKLREVGTKSGQTVQAFSILGRLTPEGMQLYAQRELHKAYETMLKEQTNKWGRENKDKFKLTDEDIEFIRRKVVQAAQLPDGRDKYVRLAEIAARIQSKIPQQKGQSFKAWQRTAMLLNPKTQIRNITGNLFAMPQFIVSDFIGTGLDKMISKSTGVRTKSGVHLSAKAFAEGLFNSWDDFVRHINTRNFENGRFEIEGHSLDNFSDRNAFTRALNKLDRFNSFLLEAGDRSFYQMWFINSLNGQMKANHVTEPTAAMIEIATDEALERTWQDDNKVSKSVSGLKRIMNNIHIGGYGLGDVVIKFSKTPANLTKAIFDFSPAGLVKALSADAYKFSQAVRDGKATPQMQRTFVKNLSNGITGTLMTFIAMAVAKAGLLTGDKDEDKDVADFEKYVKGHQPYSVKIGNSSFTYDWAQPTAALMAIAADYFENKQNEELTGEAKGFVQNVIDAIQVGGQVLYNQSFMKSIQNLFGNDGFWSGLIDTIIQDPSAMLPQALSQVAAVFDPVIRNTYENGSEAKTAVNKVLYKLPVARNTLAESVDVMGNTKMQHGSIWNRIFNNSLNPANVVKGYDSAAANEVYRLYQVTGSSSVIPSQAPNYVEVPNGGKRTLSSHEKADYQKATGKMITEAVDKLLANERYRGLSDDTKVELLGKVYSYSKQSANSEVLGIEMNESAIKAHDVISQGLPLYEYFLLKQVADENDNGAISQEEARAALDASGLTKTQKSIMWKAFNSGWKSNPYGKRYY